LRAVMDGRFTAADRDLGDARVVGESAGMPYAAPVYFVCQMLLLRLLQGAADDIARFAADYRAIFESHPDRAAMAVVAHAEAELGHEAEARRIVEELAADDFRAVRASPVRLVAATFVASACASLDDVERAAPLYGLLHAQPAQCVMWMDALALGGITHYLGLLARTMGQLDAGAAHFEDALAMSARMGARPFHARTQYEYARLLHRRGGPGDTARAAVLVAEAIATADALGMVGLRGRAGALAEAVGLPPAPPPLATPTPVRAVFRRDGDYWTIDYAEREVRLRDMNGLRYIAQLLAHPGQDVHVADLAAADNGVNAGRRHAAGDLGAVLDPHAVADYRRRLAELREELDEVTAAADAGRAERVRAEIDVIHRELATAYGLGGRVRTAGDSGERVRKAVTNQIRRVLERIRAVHPALGRHLTNSLRTGFLCAYRPENPLDWQL